AGRRTGRRGPRPPSGRWAAQGDPKEAGAGGSHARTRAAYGTPPWTWVTGEGAAGREAQRSAARTAGASGPRNSAGGPAEGPRLQAPGICTATTGARTTCASRNGRRGTAGERREFEAAARQAW